MTKKDIGKLIRDIRVRLGLTQQPFGVKYLDLDEDNAQRITSQYELGTHEIKTTLFVDLLMKTGIDLPGIIRELKENKELPPEILKDVDLAIKVLQSNTSYAGSLRMNIHSFHEAVEEKERSEQRLRDIESRLSQDLPRKHPEASTPLRSKPESDQGT